MKKQILIIDFGSQYTLVIARVITALGVQCIVLKPRDVKNLDGVKGIIFSGGNNSVYADDAPVPPEIVFESGIPILGICYGMQYMAYREDKESVWSALGKKEYGPVGIELRENYQSKLFKELPGALMVYASHGDTVHKCPAGYRVTSESISAGIQSIEHSSMPWYGVQFHPEVDDTRDDQQILKNFVFGICGCAIDWYPKDQISTITENVVSEIGQTGRAVIGVSGGVDSTTLAAMLSSVLGERLYCVLIDHGGMRKGEVEDVKKICINHGIKLNVISVGHYFINKIKTSIDAEEKRAIFKEAYSEVFLEEIKIFKATHIIQGTLATDLIESGAAGQSVKIKSHHNVGLDFGIKEVTPFSHLFKHEVRDIARNLGLSFAERQPFPGPGLYVRVVGIPVSEEILNNLREADALVTEILKEEDLYDGISQLVVGVSGSNTVGVQGDERSYKNPIVVRAVKTSDFMTVSGVYFPEQVAKRISSVLTSHGTTNRVWFDPTDKPPGTTEFE